MADYDYLKASDGTGDAPSMTITANRSTGSTTLVVSTVTKVPTKFLATSGTKLPTGLLDPSTITNFKGHVSGTNLEIDGFLPGSTDVGNTASQVVIIKPNTYGQNLVATFIQDASGLGTPEAVTFSTVTATGVTATTATISDSVAVTNNVTVGGNLKITAGTTATVDGSGYITPSKQVYTVTALGAPATIQVPSFSSWDGAPVVIRILDNGTSRGLTFAAGYTNQSGLTLPTATVATKWLTLGVMYNANTSKWQILSITVGA